MTELSVIIPCYKESDILTGRLSHIISLCSDRSKVEFIVCDAFYSASDYLSVTKIGGAYCTTDLARRSAQMHTGALKAKGKALFFLHIDSTPPPRYDKLILDAIEIGAGSGCFRLSFDISSRFLAFFAWFTRFSWGIARGGDQGLFVKADVYWSVKGFKTHMTVMEDIEIVRRLRSKSKFVVLPDIIVTSARKYMKEGVVRLQFIFGLIHLLYWCGASDETLIRTYRRFIDDGE